MILIGPLLGMFLIANQMPAGQTTSPHAWSRTQAGLTVHLSIRYNPQPDQKPAFLLRITVENASDNEKILPGTRNMPTAYNVIVIRDEYGARVEPRIPLDHLRIRGGLLFLPPHRIQREEVDIESVFKMEPGHKYSVTVEYPGVDGDAPLKSDTIDVEIPK